MPLAFLSHKPLSALDICFGMGTTFRSLVSWGIPTTAVELDPSVFKSFGYFFADADLVRSSPNANMVVDDGRRFLKRSAETFDVITVDPPPPIEAAGTSLLYSSEFFDLVKKHLKKGGILQQWMPGTDRQTSQAIARTLFQSFPYVRVFPSVQYVPVAGSIQKLGYFFICSMEPIGTPTARQMARKLPPAALKDLLEWSPSVTGEQFFQNILSLEVPPAKVLDPSLAHTITYDHPYNEYYLLRRSPWEWVRNIYR
jgi:spermidine synthase